MFVVGFISCSLLVVTFIRDPCNVINNEFIKEIKLISRLAGESHKKRINEKSINLYLIQIV